jgi:DNA-binding SARP family transcriptional activator
VDFRILGPLEVSHDGRAVPVTGTRQRELLALLLLDAGRVVSSDRLMEELWGANQPAAGSTALRVRVSQLRKALKSGRDDLLVTRPPGYALHGPRDGLDLWRFERALGEGERALRADPQRAVDALTRALAEWRGAPLVDVAHAPFAQAATVRLEELRASALELRIEAELSLGRHTTLIGELYTLTGEHPLRERLSAQLMTALYRDGRQADALAAYRAARERLVEEIGIEPGPELKALEARILAQDPDLAMQREPTSRPARTVLAVCTDSSAPAAVADRLAASSDGEAVAVGLVRVGGDLTRTTAQLRATAPRARVAAFTTGDPAGDTVRLAAEQDAAILLLATPATLEIDERTATVLRAAACDVAMLAGDHSPGAGPVLVPFSGHSHDWAAAELGAWLGGGAVTLLGVRRRDGARDASRLLASASLALQRGAGVRAETLLTSEGAVGMLEAATGAAALVVGLSDRWQTEGLGKARTQLLRDAPCPVLLVRRGVRPGGLAPPEAHTRFTWSAGS